LRCLIFAACFAWLIPPSRPQLSERIEGNIHHPQAVTALPKGRCYLASASALISEYLRVVIYRNPALIASPSAGDGCAGP
jgi:hypothetical protein